MILQVKCLQSVNGWETMYSYDMMPYRVREKIRECKYNLCAACVGTLAFRIASNRGDQYSHTNEYYLVQAINRMIEMLDEESESNSFDVTPKVAKRIYWGRF